MLGEGPQHGKHSDYLAKPFVYRAGESFKIKLPKSRGLPLLPFIFIGKGRSLEGTFIFAQGYRPQSFTALWSLGDKRELCLTPISNAESLIVLDEYLAPLERGAADIKNNCGFWDLPAPCALALDFNDTEYQLVRSYLQQARQRLNERSPNNKPWT